MSRPYLEFLSTVLMFAASAVAETNSLATVLQPFVDRGELSGAIAILGDGAREEVACVGYADVAMKRLISLDDPFQQCSQTKGFCGVTVAMLVEQGRLRLDDPISRYLPEFRELWYVAAVTNGEKILRRVTKGPTIRQSLNHTAGFDFELPSHLLIGGWSRRMPLRSVAAMAAGLPLLHEPGVKVKYSNVGIDVAAAVVERVTGRRWEEFLKERVLDPLGMTSTTFVPTDERLAQRIRLYEMKPKQVAVLKDYHPAMAPPYNDDRIFASAGAGLWTTARDQLKFYRMLMNLGMGENGVRILKEDTVRNLLAVSSRPEGMEGYSLGLLAPVRDTPDGWFGHGGAWRTSAMVNYHGRRLKLFVVQQLGPFESEFKQAFEKYAAEFFKGRNGSADAYTGRMD